jgi:formylglycine-generating enzyme required for sulfatase activity
LRFVICSLCIVLSLASCGQPADEQAAVPAGMVRIQAGTFVMGSPAGEGGGSSERPQRTVSLDEFYMGKYLVTQAKYFAVTGDTLAERQPAYYGADYGRGDDYPMYFVSWYDAITFCNKLSEMEGLVPYYTINKEQRDPGNNSPYDRDKWLVVRNHSANGYRLPTEAQWEYACRAGTVTAYNNGSDEITGDTGWYRNNGNRTHEVGGKPANPWGLYDMHGNLWEWCWDWFGDYPEAEQANPPADTVSGASRVVRGGAWDSTGMNLRSAARNSFAPASDFLINVGFRLVRQ